MNEQNIQLARTLAEKTLRKLGEDQVSATPENYSVWYRYYQNDNPGLKDAIEGAVGSGARLADSELEEIYETHLSGSSLGTRLQEISAKVAEQIADLAMSVADIAGGASDYAATLAVAAQDLATKTAPHQVLSVVRLLVQSTLESQVNTRRLEKRLAISQTELETLRVDLTTISLEARTDSLTALANRKAFDQSLETLMAEAARGGAPLSLLMADIDHFKQFNDANGHETGDQVLKLVAGMFQRSVREDDFVCRYGGEEFAVILPGASLIKAQEIGERIRKALVEGALVKRGTGEQLGPVTVSIGVSVLRLSDTAQSLVERADACLYMAKHAGRNRLVSEGGGRRSVPSVAATGSGR